MMSVKEYAMDVNLSIDKILELCKQLEIKATKEEDLLEDDAIIMLDNEIANIGDLSEETALENEIAQEELEELIEEEKREERIPSTSK